MGQAVTQGGIGGISRDRHRSVGVIATASGAFMTAGGVWALSAPRSFADFVDFPFNEHFLHDLGAFQLAIGVTLLVAWALTLRLAELGFVVGHVRCAHIAELRQFVEQKTVLLTTYRKDGTPVGAPVSIAVDGDRAVVRSPGNGGKIKRIRNDPEVEIAPSTGRGRRTGDAIRCRATELAGDEWREAGRLLRRKHPLLQGVLVPTIHHLFRKKVGPTVHLELVPVTAEASSTPAVPQSS